jgi:bacteriorhodopsin
MAQLSIAQIMLAHLQALGIRVSLAPLLAGVFCVYLTIRNDHDQHLTMAYAMAAVTFFSAAIFFSAGIGRIDLSHVLARVGLP